MGLSKITINRGEGGIGRPLPGKDHLSALVVCDEALASLNPTSKQTFTISSLFEAETLGIMEGDVNNGALWKHLKDFFTYAKGTTLRIYIPTSGAADPAGGSWAGNMAAGCDILAEESNGDVHQVAYILPKAATSAHVLALGAALQTTLDAQRDQAPMIALIPATAESDPGSATDVSALDQDRVIYIAGNPLEAQAEADSSVIGFDAPTGAILGLISSAKVHESIGWPEKFNLTTAGYTANSAGVDVAAWIAKGYLAFTTYSGLPGYYVAKSLTAATSTSDYARIESVRAMDKAVRNVRSLLLPKLNSPLYVDPDSGKLGEDTIAVFKTLASQGLEGLERDGEISGFSVEINPEQNVLSSGTIELTIKIIPVGVAEEIVLNIGYSLTL